MSYLKFLIKAKLTFPKKSEMLQKLSTNRLIRHMQYKSFVKQNKISKK